MAPVFSGKTICFFLPLPEQTCVSAQQQQQKVLRHSRLSDSACNGPPPRLTGPVGIYPAPERKISLTNSLALKKKKRTTKLVQLGRSLTFQICFFCANVFFFKANLPSLLSYQAPVQYQGYWRPPSERTDSGSGWSI